MVEPVVYLYDTHIQDTGDDWDNGIIPEATSLGPRPMPVWLIAHRELHNSRRIRLVFGVLAGSLDCDRLWLLNRRIASAPRGRVTCAVSLRVLP